VETLVVVKIDEAGADPERMERLAHGLGDELSDLALGTVRPLAGAEPPPGSRAVDLVAVGALLVSINGSVQLVSYVVDTVRAWIGRGRVARTVELTIGDRTLRISEASTEQQDRLIKEFIRAVDRE
jgi:hypothetical protein